MTRKRRFQLICAGIIFDGIAIALLLLVPRLTQHAEADAQETPPAQTAPLLEPVKAAVNAAPQPKVAPAPKPQAPMEEKQAPEPAPVKKPAPKPAAKAVKKTTKPAPVVQEAPKPASQAVKKTTKPAPVVQEAPKPAAQPAEKAPELVHPAQPVPQEPIASAQAPMAAVESAPAKPGPIEPASGASVHAIVASPVDGGFYRTSTRVEGRVEGTLAELKSLTYEVTGSTRLTGKVNIDASGAFAFAIPLGIFAGDAHLRLSAEDANGRAAETLLLLHDGTKEISIVVDTPSDGAAFGSAIRVAGSVVVSAESAAAGGGIASFSYSVAPQDYSRKSQKLKGTVALSRDNSFRLAIPAAQLSGTQVLTLNAVAKSGFSASAILTLTQGENDVPSFDLAPGDRQVILSWDPVPLAVKYDIVHAAGSSTSKGTRVSDVRSPFIIRGLANGELHSFRLVVRFEDTGTGSSGVIGAIPLSPRTLAPAVKGDYQQIRVSWTPITGSKAYDVWRSQESGGEYTLVAAGLAGSIFVDTAVDFGKEYFYQIRPAGPKAPMSAPGSGKCLAFPSEKLVHVGYMACPDGRGVAVNGGYAFVAAGERGIRVIDISDPKAPVAVGKLALTDSNSIVVRGEYAYVADGASGLRILDVSNPRAPQELGVRKTSNALAVALWENRAFVADGPRGIKVIDITNPKAPERTASLPTVNALDVAVSGGNLFVADGAGGLVIMDVTHKGAPPRVGYLSGIDARGLAVQGDTVLVAEGDKGMRVVDASNPAQPRALSRFAGAAAAVSIDGQFAFVADGQEQITVADLKNAARPVSFASRAVTGPKAVCVVNKHAYVLNGSGLEIIRVQILGRSFKVASCETGGKALHVTLDGDWAYVASHDQGIHVVAMKDPLQVTDASLAGAAETRFAENITVAGGVACVADGSSGVRFLDIAPAWDGVPDTVPTELGSYRPGGIVSRVAVVGTTAFVASGKQGVRVLDISSPSAPVEIGSLAGLEALDVLVHGSLIYIAAGDEGVRIADISNPAQPKRLEAKVSGNAKSLAQNGNLLFSAGVAGVRIIDISTPASPVVRSLYETVYAEGMAASGRRLYVAEGHKGLTVLDVSRPAQPLAVSSCEEVFAVDVAARGDYAIVADSIGLKVVRILIPDWLSR